MSAEAATAILLIVVPIGFNLALYTKGLSPEPNAQDNRAEGRRRPTSAGNGEDDRT